MKTITIIALAFAICASAFAADVALTNADAARLFVALRSAQPGLSAANTRNAALNINTLRPFIEAYDAGQQVLQRKAAAIVKDVDRDAKLTALTDETMALARQPIKAALVPIAVSDEEIKEAKIAPDSLAEFMRFLAVEPKAPEKK